MQRMRAAMKGFIGQCCLGRRKTAVMDDADKRNNEKQPPACLPGLAPARQALLPVAAIGALALFFRIKMHVGRDRADKHIGIL